MDSLKKECKKRIDTTMIGALSAVEELFGDLWNHKVYDKTDEQSEWFQRYEKLRSRILDNGNNQKRKIDEDIDKYDIDWKKYHYDIRVSDNLKGRV